VSGGSGRAGPNPVERFTASYQCEAQIPSVSRPPAGQRSIASENGMPSASHRAGKTARGFASSVSASMTGGEAPISSAAWSKSSACCENPISPKSTASRFAEYEASTRAGWRMRKACRQARIQSRPISGSM
jgi:hypothetical protein